MSLLQKERGKKPTNRKLSIELTKFIDQNVKYLYDYKRRRVADEELNQEQTRLTFFYRGMSNCAYKAVPGIYRKSEWHEENYYYNEISVRCPEIFRTLNNLEKLTYMQHYGCPTRLLDITSNPLVALYFACSGKIDIDGEVVIFAVNERDVLYSNSDRIQMLSKLAEFKRDEQNDLRLLAYYYLNDDKFPQSSNRHYANTVVERFYHAVKRNNGAFERDIIPFDILRPQFVQPNKDNPRILKQDGAFIISGLNANEDECEMKIQKYIIRELLIPGKYKADILKQLEYVGINQATLFPEVEKVADYLRRRK